MPSKKDAKNSEASSSPTKKGGDAGQAEMQERFDAAAEKGYFGHAPDPTPNENYSLETGPDAPTPETDAALEGEARKAAGLGKGALEHRASLKEGKK